MAGLKINGMNSKLILLCATDAGGMRNILPILDLIDKEQHLESKVVASEVTMVFLENRTEQCELLTFVDDEDAKDFLIRTTPRSVICGTTRYMSPERLLTKAAKELGITVVAVLDEWFNYRLRFEDESGDLTFLPDIICCQDEQAKREAVQEGIPENVLYVTGSPSLCELTTRSEVFFEHPPDVPDYYQACLSRFSITFLSETHSTDYGTKPGQKGLLGPFLGYTEKSVRKDLSEVVNGLGTPFCVLEKLHPSANPSEYLPLGSMNIEWVCVTETDLWPLLWHSDLVIGMRSMALLEAKILGCNVISYQPNFIGPDLCTVVRLGLAESLCTISQLNEFLSMQVRIGFNGIKRQLVRYPFADNRASETVLNLALSNSRRIP